MTQNDEHSHKLHVMAYVKGVAHVLAVLQSGHCEQTILDLYFREEQEVEFGFELVKTKGEKQAQHGAGYEVHLAGYLEPDMERDFEDEEEEEESDEELDEELDEEEKKSKEKTAANTKANSTKPPQKGAAKPA